MAALTSPSRILVTGANGFIASYLVGLLLQKGHTVVCAVREASKAQRLLEIYSGFKERGRLEIAVVPEMKVDGAYDQAVEGCEGIVHAAAQMGMTAEHPEDIIVPTVNGTLSILKSAVNRGSSLKRIVYISSCTAINAAATEPCIVNEEVWNDGAIARCERLGKDAEGIDKYSASKTIAEKRAWEFVKKHRPSWDLVTICPPWVFGPVIHTTDDTPNFTNQCLRTCLREGTYFGLSLLTEPGHGWVDSRDVAAACVKALEVPEAGGERIIVNAGEFVWQDFVCAANSLRPNPNLQTYLHRLVHDRTKEKRILAMKYRSMEETVCDMLVQFEREKW
ncbi:D-lactaldehyde dehydrogenase [Atractiella rhizophila]|nr:D-lactaldehyde dehydrogenase [Atractiella rhizophila]